MLSGRQQLRQPDGGIAQLGERLNGIQEVSGSIPLISTKTKRTSKRRPFCFGKGRLGEKRRSNTRISFAPAKAPLQRRGGAADQFRSVTQGRKPRSIPLISLTQGTVLCVSFPWLFFCSREGRSPPGLCFPPENRLIMPENKGKTALHGQHKEPSPTTMGLEEKPGSQSGVFLLIA